MTKQTKNTQPVDSLRIGRVEAAIWNNGTDGNPLYSVTITRTYRENGRYKTSRSFDTADLANVAKLGDWALNRIIKLQKEAAQ